MTYLDPKVHGQWLIDVSVERRMVLIKGQGAWNEEAALLYANDFKQRVSPLLDHTWACIGYGVDWELGTPEIEPILHALYEWMVTNGCRLQTTLMHNQIAKAQIGNIMSVAKPDYRLEIVSSTIELLTLVEASGFELDSATFDRFIKRSY